MKVAFFLRKKSVGNYSIESLFALLKEAMPTEVQVVERTMRFKSKGLINRLAIMAESFFKNEELNHVTGDIHFISLVLPSKHTLLTIHDIGFTRHPLVVARFFLKWFWLIFPIRHCAIITTVSNATKLDILKYVPATYAQKIHVIYNPLKPPFSSFPKPFNEYEPTILQIGTKYNKNLKRLVEAIAPLRCRLQIVGKLTEDQISHLLAHKINYMVSTNLSDAEIFEKYKEADIISFVSTNEGFGFPIIEGNAVGRPVITSNISSMPEVAGDAAHLVDPYNVEDIRAGFVRIIKDPRYRDRLIENGFENVKRFKLEKIVQQYVSLYLLLKGGRRL